MKKAFQIAAELYTNRADDAVSQILTVLLQTKGMDISEILSAYNQIASGTVQVIFINFATKADIKAKGKLEEEIISHLDKKNLEYVFIYREDPDLIRGIKVFVGDTVFDGSLASKIDEI